ncbi:MAG TPA: hypothetical protein VMY87_10185 [Armatimonadota bacterium]|nr:hypothetical protein [Armatimonadota bacterium]
MKRERNLPAGNWAPYVQWCIRRGLWLRGAAVAVSVAGCVFFAAALWLATQGRAILGIDTFRGGVGLVAQVGATVFLALELAAARREYRQV